MQIALSDIRLGHEHQTKDLNVRRAGRDDVAQTAASLREKGQVYPVILWRDPDDGALYAIDGNRRVAAFRMLAEAEDIGPDHAVDAIIRDEPYDQLIDTGLIANLERAPLHPVDQFYAFARMVAAGQARDAIAARYSMTPQQVEHALALGKLSDKVREAWRADKLDARTAQAFAIKDDLQAQDRVLESILKMPYRPGPSEIHKLLLGSGEALSKELNFVGEEAYLAAGGELVKDLFGGTTYVLSTDLLVQLVLEKLTPVLTRLTDDGWGWAKMAGQMPDGYYSWPTLRPEPAYTDEEQAELDRLEAARDGSNWSATEASVNAIKDAAQLRLLRPEHRAVAGCVVSLKHDGSDVSIRWGVVDVGSLAPEQVALVEPFIGAAYLGIDRPKPAASAPTDPTAIQSDEPAAVIDALRETQTHALADTVAGDPDGAMNLFLATAICRGHSGSPLCFRLEGRSKARLGVTVLQLGGEDSGAALSFVDAVDFVAGLSLNDRDRLFAAVVAATIDTTSRARRSDVSDGRSVTQGGITTTYASVDPAAYVRNLRDRFDAAAYFGGVRKDSCIAAIRDTLGEATAKAWASKKKGEVAAFCVDKVPPTGWLPKEVCPVGFGAAPPATAEAPQDAPQAPADAAPLPKLPKAKRAALAVLWAAGSTSRDKAIGPVAGNALNPQTVGALIADGYAAKASASRGGEKVTIYWLTESGADLARAYAEGGK